MTAPDAHRDAVRTIASLAPSGLRLRFVRHLLAHPDGLYRTCSPDHITASMLVLSSDHTHVLLTLHAKAQQWFQLGGHCEATDATLQAAATREAREESGLDDLVVDPTPIHLDEHAVPFCSAGPATHHLDVRFLAIAAPTASYTVSEESLDVRWWPVTALPSAEPSMLDLVRCALLRVGVVGDVDIVSADAQV